MIAVRYLVSLGRSWTGGKVLLTKSLRGAAEEPKGERLQAPTIFPKVRHKLLRGLIEQGGHIIVQGVHVLGQPGSRVVIHLPGKRAWGFDHIYMQKLRVCKAKSNTFECSEDSQAKLAPGCVTAGYLRPTRGEPSCIPSLHNG